MAKYKVGDRVRIVEKWVDGCSQNPKGLMDEWLGKVMTVMSEPIVNPNLPNNRFYYFMKEDYGKWLWNEKCIAGLADCEKAEQQKGVQDMDYRPIDADACEQIKRMPTIELVRYGQWKEIAAVQNIGKCNIPISKCSLCGFSFCDILNRNDLYSYCPGCGAKMILEEK